MKTTNITKGDWAVSNGDQIVSMPSQCKIANRISGWTLEEVEANAKLMAAAPELLKACIAVMNGGYGCAPSVEFMDDLKMKCEYAIKKATE